MSDVTPETDKAPADAAVPALEARKAEVDTTAQQVAAKGKAVQVSDLNLYYGAFKAVEGVNMEIRANKVTAFIGSSGCGKSTVLRALNRMHELIQGARVEGSVVLDGQDIYASNVDPVLVRERWAWCSSSPTRSRRCRSTTTSRPVSSSARAR